jgi:sulfur carrier protein
VKLNGEEIGAFHGTVVVLLESRGWPVVGVVVALNGTVVPRSQWASTHLDEAAEVEVLTASAGG